MSNLTLSKNQFLEELYYICKACNIDHFEIIGELPERVSLNFDIYIGTPDGDHYLYKVIR